MASSSRGVQQDSFIDEEEDTCPLCVEEFDLSDKNFKPCPCGYQVCQFCFNNIKTNMNGLCPACRRPYSEDTMEFKIVTQEQIAQFKANAQKKAKKNAADRQKEAQKREVESLNRKHLAGLRVVQRNLVYVMGLSPGIPEQDLLQTLRGDKYFGQYGKIIKIAVGKAKSGETPVNNTALGVYVTFAKKEDAARCISAVNGSQNGDRILRAQLGTTKYCSAYLRGETCTNKSCMFLHEPGDNEDSYSRADLSTINSAGTQRPLPVSTPSTRQAAQTQAPMQQAQPMAAAAPAMARETSKEGSDNADSSALPSSASWANRGQLSTSRRASIATSGEIPSPAVTNAMPAPAEVPEQTEEDTSEPTVEEPISRPHRVETPLQTLVRSINALSLLNELSSSPDASISEFPPLFDEYGGAKRRAFREQEEARIAEEEARRIEQDAQSEVHTIAESHEEEAPESGSLQLGGEPEDRDTSREGSMSQSFHEQRRTSSQMPISRASNDSSAFGGLGHAFQQGPSSRSMTPQQQQQHMLGLFKSAQPQSNFMDQFPPGMGNPSQVSSFQQIGHNRQSSRYNFGNDGASIKAPATKVGNAAMMSTAQAGQFYGSSIQGPPPGLKSTGTPPINGTGMFGQGSGFSGALGGSFGTNRENDIYRDMMRGRGGVTGEAGKHDYDIPSQDETEAALAVDSLVSDDNLDVSTLQHFSGSNNPSRTGTPSIPPGFEGLGQPSPPKAATRMEPKIAPFTPSRTTSFAHVATPLANVSVPSTPTAKVAIPILAGSTSKAKIDTKNLATSTGLSKEIAAQREGTTNSRIQPEDFPALEINKDEDVASPAPSKQPLTPAKRAMTPSSTSAVSTTPIESERILKRQSSLITVAPLLESQQSSGTELSRQESVPKAFVETTNFPPLPPSAPVAAGAHTVAPRTVLKPLRIVSTPKAEFPPSESSTPLSAAPPVNLIAPQVRQVSLATAVSRLERPGTPASEHISDVASIPSTLSRPNSPPLSRIGSAPVREKTKSQQKKQRKEAQREKEKSELEVVKDAPEPEVHIAPIEGRKKKQKKEKPAKVNTAHTTPAASRAPSPKPAESSKTSKRAPAPEPKPAPVKLPEPEKPYKTDDDKPNMKLRPYDIAASPPQPTVETEKEPELQPLTPMNILNELRDSGEIDPSSISILRALTSSIYQRSELNSEMSEFEPRLVITDEDRASLQAGRPVQKSVQGVHRIMLTPNGDCVRNLTPEEEKRYLDLQNGLAKKIGPAQFVSHRHSQTNGFSLIQGRAVPNGPPSFFPQAAGIDQAPLEAVSKIQRDEALSYINQYVLPSLSTNSQLERALNANAMDAGMHPPTNSQPWGSWSASLTPSSDKSGHDQAYGGNSDGGILATGLESMTAHFAVGRDYGRGQPLGNVQLLSLSDSESALQTAKKETEKLEKQFNQLLKKNRKLLLGAGH